LAPSSRAAAATYLEVFLLIGLAIGGSGLVLGAMVNATASAQGPAISVTGATIRQGTFLAIESLTIYNTGSVPLQSFVLSTGGVPATASFCYTLFDPMAHSILSTTCPSMGTNPASVVLATTVSPGKGVLAELTVMGQQFSLGAISKVTVTSSGGAQQSLDVGVVPA